ncbi:MAG TPA: 1-(5-phosphoribosyl)-5-[(5-phosphoribosylamino)methylideneamino]imidazole-4-carboxamide isomerase [Elusimicrobiota bacterium]|nr:1-(5-phosphoribosyl)-5-[(5-phosphoribosylamino)methylideneamino]imidazole-4-carboxamide isomerase [Elusimicrobiota bacterium]
MLVVPAVDIKAGRCVRLVHGDPRRETVYSADPVETARRWASQGARRVHVVDLDAALGTGTNLDLIFRIRQAVDCEIQVGGGLRDIETVRRVLSVGIDRVVLGTALLKSPDWVKKAVDEFKGSIVAGVDASPSGEVKSEGWTENLGFPIIGTILHVEKLGIREVIYTDISKDGTLSGPNIETTRLILKKTKMGVYASGGVSGLDDIKALKLLEPEGLRGCIVGKALYDGRLAFADALAVAGQ